MRRRNPLNYNFIYYQYIPKPSIYIVLPYKSKGNPKIKDDQKYLESKLLTVATCRKNKQKNHFKTGMHLY